MNAFFQRVANYVGNEIIIKGLANSKTFQRFAVRTSKQYEEISKHGQEKLNQTIEELMNETAAASGKPAAAMDGPPRPPLRGIPGFFSSFFKEIRKDVTFSERW